MYRDVLTKQDFVRRFMANEFGNRGPNWETYSELVDSGYYGPIHLRSREAGGATYYNLDRWKVGPLWDKLQATSRTHYLAAMAPTEKTLIQGEVQRGVEGLRLYYSRHRSPMRESLVRGGVQTFGLRAILLLQHYLCQNSYEWLTTLLDRYDDHVIEFSAYECNWGTIPGFNTVFWEVRKY